MIPNTRPKALSALSETSDRERYRLLLAAMQRGWNDYREGRRIELEELPLARNYEMGRSFAAIYASRPRRSFPTWPQGQTLLQFLAPHIPKADPMYVAIGAEQQFHLKEIGAL